MRNIAIGFTALAFVGFVGSVAAAQEAPPDSAEARVLARWIGEWDEEQTLKPGPWVPQGDNSTSVTKREWSLGGKIVRAEGVLQPGKNAFLHLLAYDAVVQVYRSWYFDAVGSIPRGPMTGTWDEKTKTMTWRGTDEGGNTMVGTNRYIDDDHMEWKLVATDAAGKVALEMEGTSARRKK